MLLQLQLKESKHLTAILHRKLYLIIRGIQKDMNDPKYKLTRQQIAKKYYQKNKEKCKKVATEWQRSHPEITRLRHQKYYQRNKKKILAKQKLKRLQLSRTSLIIPCPSISNVST